MEKGPIHVSTTVKETEKPETLIYNLVFAPDRHQ